MAISVIHMAYGVVNTKEPASGTYLTKTYEVEGLTVQEIHNALLSIRVETNGDDVNSAYLEVNSLYEDAAVEAWIRIAFQLDTGEWWQ